jgi:hypothetical protein
MALPRTKRSERQMEASSQNRVAITIISRRKRLLDSDNVCAKFAIDALRYAGVIPDDDSRFISSLTIKQEKSPMPETIIIVEKSHGDDPT